MKQSFTSRIKTNNSSQFLSLSNKGTYTLRIITEPYHCKKYFFVNGLTKTSITVPSDVNLKTDVKARDYWYMGAIDRSTEETVIINVTAQIFDKLAGFSEHKSWGKLSSYDVEITCNPSAGASNYYSVIPQPKSALSANDHVLMDNFDETFLEKLTNPTEYQEKFAAAINNTGSNGVQVKGWDTI